MSTNAAKNNYNKHILQPWHSHLFPIHLFIHGLIIENLIIESLLDLRYID